MNSTLLSDLLARAELIAVGSLLLPIVILLVLLCTGIFKVRRQLKAIRGRLKSINSQLRSIELELHGIGASEQSPLKSGEAANPQSKAEEELSLREKREVFAKALERIGIEFDDPATQF